MLRKSTKITFALLNFIGLLGVIVVNALAVMLPINNVTTQELSDKYPNLFVPAGITFSVWGVIYILLVLFIIYQFVAAFRKSPDERGIFEKTGILFFLSCVFNIAWILSWHYEIVWLSLIIMILLLLSLIFIYVRLGTGRPGIKNYEKVFVNIPFSVYLGWITIATIANVTAYLVSINWNRFGISEQLWTVIIITVGVIITIAALFSRNDIFFPLVVIWALVGILLKRIADTSVPDNLVTIASIAGISIVAIGIIAQLIRKKKIY
ncbi:MAG: hypothetical protein PHQ09_05320 [Actinomycetota bacterium]|nr:hypothetical protein [Actinomycetota bacterium]